MNGKRLVDPVPNMDRLDLGAQTDPVRPKKGRFTAGHGRWFRSGVTGSVSKNILNLVPVLVAVLAINCIKIK